MTITNREVIDEFKEAQVPARSGGTPAGGGPGEADRDAAGGSADDDDDDGVGRAGHDGLSRGERLDILANGGRGDDTLDQDGDEEAALDPDEPLKQDLREHQDQGQRWIDEHGGAPDGSDRQA